MSSIYLTSVARQHADWLSVRQVQVSQNIANANTPEFKARDLEPFAVQSKEFSRLLVTNSNHIANSSTQLNGATLKRSDGWETVYSGNNVSVPVESLKLGEIGASFELNTSVMKSFHRLVLATYAG